MMFFRAAFVAWFIVGVIAGFGVCYKWDKDKLVAAPVQITKHTVTPHVLRFYELLRVSVDERDSLNISGPPPEMLIAYCIMQAQSTEAFARERDEGNTLKETVKEVEEWATARNTNDSSEDDIPVIVVQIILNNLVFAYSKPTWSARQIWDDVYRRCVTEEIV